MEESFEDPQAHLLALLVASNGYILEVANDAHVVCATSNVSDALCSKISLSETYNFLSHIRVPTATHLSALSQMTIV